MCMYGGVAVFVKENNQYKEIISYCSNITIPHPIITPNNYIILVSYSYKKLSEFTLNLSAKAIKCKGIFLNPYIMMLICSRVYTKNMMNYCLRLFKDATIRILNLAILLKNKMRLNDAQLEYYADPGDVYPYNYVNVIICTTFLIHL